jgi:hypothetical protein
LIRWWRQQWWQRPGGRGTASTAHLTWLDRLALHASCLHQANHHQHCFSLSAGSNLITCGHAPPLALARLQIGTCFLWIFWPSFNGALASASPGTSSPQQFHCVVNTVLALLGACVATFAMSAALEGKFNMVGGLGAAACPCHCAAACARSRRCAGAAWAALKLRAGAGW